MTDASVPSEAYEDSDFELPEGFAPLAVTGQQNWVVKKPGVTVRGVLKGRFERNKRNPKDKDSYFYQIKLTDDGCPAIFNKENVTLKRGDMVCVDESKALEVLESLASEDDSVYEVFIKYIDKVPNQRDPRTSFWRTAVGSKRLEGDQIPF